MQHHPETCPKSVHSTWTQKKPKRRFGFTLVEGIVVIAIIGVLVAFLFPSVRRSREAARRSQCKNNLKQIALALQHYEETYKFLPPPYTVDSDGKRLHSWRTLILPFLDRKEVYEKIDLSKAWDDPANAAAFKTNVPEYHCPSEVEPMTHTTYLAVVSSSSCFRPDKPTCLRDITDGTTNTLLVIEVDHEHAVHWMAPTDADMELLVGLGPKSKLDHSGGFHVAVANGAVHFLSDKVSGDVRRGLVSINGGESICSDF